MHKSMQTRRSRSPSFFVILSRVSEIIVKDRQTYDRFRELTVTDRRTETSVSREAPPLKTLNDLWFIA